MDIKSKNYMETNTVIINQLTWFVMFAFKFYISTEMFTPTLWKYPDCTFWRTAIKRNKLKLKLLHRCSHWEIITDILRQSTQPPFTISLGFTSRPPICLNHKTKVHAITFYIPHHTFTTSLRTYMTHRNTHSAYIWTPLKVSALPIPRYTKITILHNRIKVRDAEMQALHIRRPLLKQTPAAWDHLTARDTGLFGQTLQRQTLHTDRHHILLLSL